MAVKYIPFSPNVIHGQAVLDNFVRTQRILRYQGDGEVFTSLQHGMRLFEVVKEENVGSLDTENLVLHGECLSACAYLKENGIQVDLVYIDPPFASGTNYDKKIVLRRNPKAQEKLKDSEQIEITDLNSLELDMYGDIWEKEKYLNWMYENLMAIKSVMSENASIYVHLDWHIVHYVKILMDEIFGEDNFRNDISWHYSGWNKKLKSSFEKRHDTILFYSMDEEGKNFNSFFEQYESEEEYIRRRKQKPLLDENGRRYVLSDAGNGNRIKRYVDEAVKEGVVVDDVWDLDKLNNSANESVDYSTQKPEALLERIIKASSNEGMVVADFFGGSGVTATVAHKLGRRFIHNDVGINSIQTARDRLVAAGASFTHMEIKDGVNLFRNPQQTNDKLMELTGVSKAAFASDFWSGSITDSKLGMIPVHLPNFLAGKRPMVDDTFLKVLVHEQMAAIPDNTKKVIIYYIDTIDKDMRDEFIRKHNIFTETEIDFQDLKPLLDNVVVEDEIDCSLAEVTPEGGMFPVWQVTINSFISDRVLKNISDENEKRYQQYLKKLEKTRKEGKPDPKFVKINVSDEGLETIEWLSLDCQTAEKSAPWHSDVEIKIDKAGYMIRNGKKTNTLWDGTITTDDNAHKPLRLKIRNICGDETIIVL